MGSLPRRHSSPVATVSNTPDFLADPVKAKQRPSLLRRILRWLIRCILAFVAIALLYLLAVWILGAIPVNRSYRAATTGIDIMIQSNGVHTDFYLPAKTPEKDWTSYAPLQSMTPYFANANYVLIGWGDRGFFLDTKDWGDLTVATTLNAIFLPSVSVMHLYYRYQMPPPGKRAVKLRLSSAEYRRFVAYIETGFKTDSAGNAVLIPDRGYSSSDVFYEGIGSYHMLNTCNNWANRALDAAGVTTPVWSPFDSAIFEHLPR